MITKICQIVWKYKTRANQKKGKEPAYVVPTTPSPFLHAALAPQGPVPPFGFDMFGMDLGLKKIQKKTT